ncbi:MAG: glutamine amidotransferase subunit PdxT [Deltaproteobacteria bacterium RBG_19FT_COMBO_43_11]|nr:MAG: glutamine amidotransferase subunit PdxT [Deltaproteobacteria bacterium RBG_19FT_COMBO_43_11]
MALHLVKNNSSTIGVLDLQGGVHEHLDHLERLEIANRRVKQKDDFTGLAGLIIPGGESTCLARLLNIFDLKEIIRKHYRRGMKIWGTCAGAILLAKKVVADEPCLALIDMEIERNGFGSQLDSFTSEALISAVADEPIPLTFIRAPKILRVGKDVKVLLKIDDYIAAAENENVLVTVFHPELTGCVALHRYFALKCGLKPTADIASNIDPRWESHSWTRLSRIACL